MSSIDQLKSVFRRAAWVIALYSLVTNFLMLVAPLYMLQIYDRVLGSGSLDTLKFISLLAVAALLLFGIVDILRSRYATRLSARLAVKLGEGALGLAMASPKAVIGDIQPLRDLSTVRSFVGSKSFFVFFDLPFAPLFAMVLYLIHPHFFVIVMAGFVGLAALAIASALASSGAVKDAGDASLSAFSVAQSFVRDSEVIKAMGMAQSVTRIWGKQSKSELIDTDRSASIIAMFSGWSRTFRLVLQITVLGYGAVLVLDQQITAGMIFASSLIASRALQPIDQLVAIWPQITQASQAWTRLKEGLRTPEDHSSYTDLPISQGQLQVEKLVYAPPGSPQGEFILKGISLELKPGESVAIVGRSGAGKSTLARLMVGAIMPSGGTIRIDGGDIRNWDPLALGKSIGYLPQNADLLPGTIAENICRFQSDVDDADIIAAAKIAQAHDLIQSLPLGYGTRMGPGGVILSGGQRQRVGLARAFFGSPKFIVLDEPNSNLDSEGDLALELAISSVCASGSTVVVVSQKRHIVRAVDKMAEIEGGLVREFGTVSEVMSAITARTKKIGERPQKQETQIAKSIPDSKNTKSPAKQSAATNAKVSGEQ